MLLSSIYFIHILYILYYILIRQKAFIVETRLFPYEAQGHQARQQFPARQPAERLGQKARHHQRRRALS